ncbi:hypothetical protein JCM17961_00470 [Endothiovibrio diazotrophicus]
MRYYGGALTGGGGYLPFPFFLATAGALAKRRGMVAVVRDSVGMGERYDDYYRFVESFAPDAVVMETSTPSLGNDLEIAARLKAMLPGVVIVFTGIHAELEEERFLRSHDQVDYVVYGEYDSAVCDLLEAIDRGEPVDSLHSLLYRAADGRVVKRPFGPLVDLDSLPWPERDDLPDENYFDAVCGLESPQLQINTTRGCPYGCIFCVWPQMVYKGKKYRRRSPLDVVDEIEANFKKYPYKSFYIDDDTFNIDKKHVLEFARLLKERGLSHIPWGAMCRADLMSEEVLVALREAGLYSVKYGVESADQTVLDEIDKRIEIERIVEMVEKTKEVGIKVHLTYTFGLPADTEETIEGTIDLACRLPADSVQFSIATPFPGTSMYEIYKEKGWLTSNEWTDYDGSAKAVSRTERFSGEQLEEYVKLAYRRWEEQRIGQMLEGEAFRGRFDGFVKQRVPEKGRVLVMQSAPIPLTRGVIRELQGLGYEVHLLGHQRFMESFEDLVRNGEVHAFSNSGDFRYKALKPVVDEVGGATRFDGVVVPYNNATGSGYEEVRALARDVSTTLIAVTMGGEVMEV